MDLPPVEELREEVQIHKTITAEEVAIMKMTIMTMTIVTIMTRTMMIMMIMMIMTMMIMMTMIIVMKITITMIMMMTIMMITTTIMMTTMMMTKMRNMMIMIIVKEVDLILVEVHQDVEIQEEAHLTVHLPTRHLTEVLHQEAVLAEMEEVTLTNQNIQEMKWVDSLLLAEVLQTEVILEEVHHLEGLVTHHQEVVLAEEETLLQEEDLLQEAILDAAATPIRVEAHHLAEMAEVISMNQNTQETKWVDSLLLEEVHQDVARQAEVLLEDLETHHQEEILVEEEVLHQEEVHLAVQDVEVLGAEAEVIAATAAAATEVEATAATAEIVEITEIHNINTRLAAQKAAGFLKRNYYGHE
ncbi:hypothetical protein C3729_02320 [Cloacibacterium normanense]|uniref:Uncharacterized protein n=1 Tax=Cloacibacterium normanense TaxID=237258 RepID=A0A2S7I8H2_9FLAO|nr:hypothetical protein C3729_02320 [Cloacibacterium normanense]